MPTTSIKTTILHIRTTLSAYFSLEKKHRSIIFDRVIEGNYSPLYWKSLLEKIADFDSKADAVRPRVGNISASLIAAGIFSNFFLAAFLLSNELYTIYTVVQVVLLVIIGFGALLLLVYIFLKSQDIPDYLREFILPLLVILNEEMKAGELLHLSIDLRKKARKNNQIDRQTSYKEGAVTLRRIVVFTLIIVGVLMVSQITSEYDSGILMFFAGLLLLILVGAFNTLFIKYPRTVHTTHLFPWLKAQGRLYDGTKLDIGITDEVHKYRITRMRRGASGKTKVKTKIKYKIRTTYQVNLGLPTQKYDLTHRMKESRKKLRNAEGIKVRNEENERREVVKFNVRKKVKELNYKPELHQFLGWVAKAYQQFSTKNSEK